MMSKARIFSIALIICIMFFGACNKSSEKPTEIRRTTAELKKMQMLKEVQNDYKNADKHYQLGKLYQEEGQWAQADHEFTVALSFDPVHRQSQAAKVKSFASSGDTSNSQLAADFYMNQAFTSALGSLELAMAFQKEALDDYAFKCYRRALALAPNSAKVNRQIGFYYLSKGDDDRGRDYLTRSFQLNPNQPEVALALGKLGVAVKAGQKAGGSAKKVDRAFEQQSTYTPQ